MANELKVNIEAVADQGRGSLAFHYLGRHPVTLPALLLMITLVLEVGMMASHWCGLVNHM